MLHRVADVKARVSVPSLLGLVAAPKHKVRCPICTHPSSRKSPSLWITETAYRCYRCNSRGDVISMAMKMWNCEFRTALTRLSGSDKNWAMPDRTLEIEMYNASVAEAERIDQSRNDQLDDLYRDWEYRLLVAECSTDPSDAPFATAAVNASFGRQADEIECMCQATRFNLVGIR